MSNGWTCSRCARAFTRKNQRHACGAGDRSEVLRGRPAELVDLYQTIEAFAHALGPIEIVARERYVLMRSVRIFADLVIMKDSVRIAIHLQREVSEPHFIKVVSDRRHVTHVAKLRTKQEFAAIERYLGEAYRASLGAPMTR